MASFLQISFEYCQTQKFAVLKVTLQSKPTTKPYTHKFTDGELLNSKLLGLLYELHNTHISMYVTVCMYVCIPLWNFQVTGTLCKVLICLKN